MLSKNKKSYTKAQRHLRGDRYDAKLVRDLPPLKTMMMHLMPKRTEAEVWLPDKLDVTELLKYVEKKKAANPELRITPFQCVIAALARMAKERPLTNCFVQGRQLYERNKITIGFVCKVKKEDDATEELIIYTANNRDNLDDVCGKITQKIKHAKENAGHISTADSSMKKLARLPRGVLTVLFAILRKFDYFGADLSFLTDGDINYCSILVSNLGSVGMSSIYHHLNNYGTNSMVVTLGKIHKEEVIYPDGSREVRDLLDIGTTVDERVADGFYYSQCVILLKKIIENPELLDIPLGTPLE